MHSPPPFSSSFDHIFSPTCYLVIFLSPTPLLRFYNLNEDSAHAESGAAWTAFKEKYLKDDDDNPQIVFVDGIPKSAKWADIYNFFSTIEDIEETHIYGNPKYGFKGQVTLAFKSEEAARAFVKSKVMYGNVELSKQSKRDFGIYNCLNKTQFGQHKYHR